MITIRTATAHLDKPILKVFCLRISSDLVAKIKLFLLPIHPHFEILHCIQKDYTTVSLSLISPANILHQHMKEDVKNTFLSNFVQI